MFIPCSSNLQTLDFFHLLKGIRANKMSNLSFSNITETRNMEPKVFTSKRFSFNFKFSFIKMQDNKSMIDPIMGRFATLTSLKK